MKSPDSPSPTTAPTIYPILYHRTGGFAGTDDRVVIWPDGVVQVQGRLLVPGMTRLRSDRLERLVNLFDGWTTLNDRYLAADVADAYTITIHYGGKSVEASDLAADLPAQFRRIFEEIESIAAEAGAAAPQPADNAAPTP